MDGKNNSSSTISKRPPSFNTLFTSRSSGYQCSEGMASARLAIRIKSKLSFRKGKGFRKLNNELIRYHTSLTKGNIQTIVSTPNLTLPELLRLVKNANYPPSRGYRMLLLEHPLGPISSQLPQPKILRHSQDLRSEVEGRPYIDGT
ncbi:hypothetical protein PHLCEN_2v2805 [Hermanssonia centrifuga]|uniref:Uncharacterized protein n=1 Tax=Hermanssonia centrifuga TaxID=98765 RepID=A0A2R6RI09_9APHY|nr:hypothetical protein PHLCEN_2v2805 [Hermanssonia centrifuga]